MSDNGHNQQQRHSVLPSEVARRLLALIDSPRLRTTRPRNQRLRINLDSIDEKVAGCSLWARPDTATVQEGNIWSLGRRDTICFPVSSIVVCLIA